MEKFWQRINKIKMRINLWNILLKQHIGGLYFPMLKVWTRKPTQFKKYSRPICCGKWIRVCFVKKIKMLQYPCVHGNLQKYEEVCEWNIKNTRSGKPDSEEASHIEGFVNPKIRDKYNVTPKNSPVDYAYMLLLITKKYAG